MKTLKNIVRNMIQEFHKKTYFRQVLLSYIVVSCFTFLIFSILLLSRIQQENNRTILNFGWQNIEQAMSFNDSSLHDISNYAYQMLDEAATYRLLYGDTFDLPTSIASREIYDRIQSSNSMITSLDFINFSTGTVLTKSRRMSLDEYYDKDLLEYIGTLVPSRRPVFYQPRVSYFNGKHTQTQRVLSLIFYTNSRGALVINLDYDSYASQINLARNSGNMDLIIVNHNHCVMAASQDTYFMQDLSDDPLYQEILQQHADTGSFTWQSKTGAQTIMYRKNALMGITYISVISPHKAYSRSYLFGLTFRYSIVYILVTSLLSLLASLALYRPVRHLKHTIHINERMPDENAGSTRNDFELIETVFQNLIEKYTALKQVRHTFEHQKEQKLLRLLLEQPSAAIQPNSEDFLALDNSFEYENYMVFVVNVDMPSEPDTENDLSLIKFLIENVTMELMDGIAAIRSIETITPRVLFLANFAGFDDRRREQFLTAARQMQELFRQRGQFQVAAGFGSVTDALDTISVSYETARTALDTGMLHAMDSIVFYDEMQIPPFDEQTYPFTIDTAVTAAVKNTDTAALDTALDHFFEAIRPYECDQIHRHLSHLSDALQRFEHANDLGTLYTENDLNSQPRLLSEYREQFRNRCHSDIQALSEIKLHNHSKDALISQVQDLVSENIYNANLSVIMIAEQVGLSVNYLRNIYKENTGESLSTYITGCKLEIIYELLAKTDTSIQEISDRLGFATKNYFFTFFKKHTGMTPNQYRSQNKIE